MMFKAASHEVKPTKLYRRTAYTVGDVHEAYQDYQVTMVERLASLAECRVEHRFRVMVSVIEGMESEAHELGKWQIVRVLFIFDPRRTAILLLGGDKARRWNAWYKEAVPRADALYDAYLEELRREGIR